MMTSRFSAGASRFAQFAGLVRARAADDDEDQEPKGKKGRAAADDDDQEPKGKKGRAADEGDDEGDDEPKGKKGRAAADDDDDGEPKGKRSRRAADDDDDDGEDDDKQEMEGSSAKAAARRREQARIAHILSAPAASHNLPLALSLACETRMTRTEAVRVLGSQAGHARDDREPAGNRHARGDRTSRNVPLGSDAGPVDGKQAVKSSWAATWDKLGVKTR